MNLTPIRIFFTPIKYGNQPITWRQKMTEVVDAYFNLRGRVAIVVPGRRQNGCEGVKLQAGRTIWWQSILKVMSYGAYFLNLLVTARFPGLTANRRVVQFQRILNCFPVFMLIAKIMLRSTSRFHLYQEKDDPKDVSSDTANTASFLPISGSSNDLILPQVKKTLDDLFGGVGSVDKLPIYRESSYEADTMTAPIMKGISVNPKNNRSNPFILIKMRCLSALQEIEKSFVLIPPAQPTRSIEEVVVLRPLYIEDPLMWMQQEGDGIHPCFFNTSGNFTYAENGELVNAAVQPFLLLKRVIKEGRGEDSHGISWEIIGHEGF